MLRVPGDVVGVRGPFGRPWPVDEAEGRDVVIVAGGIGLAPLRPALLHVLARRERYGRVTLLYGGRAPEQLLFREQLAGWRAREDLDVGVTVDMARGGWRGRVGVVPALVPGARLDPENTTAMICGPEIMMRASASALTDRGVPASSIHISMERNMQCGFGRCGHCQLGPTLICRDGPVYPLDDHRPLVGRAGALRPIAPPKLAVWKFASCDGCQLSLLNCEDELLTLAGEIEIAHFLEASSAVVPGPYDLSLVEGSVTTPEDAKRIKEIRRNSRRLVTIGACATAGGIQALRNFADVDELMGVVYASPEYISTLATSTRDQRPRHGRLRAARLPDRPRPAARGDQRDAQRPAPGGAAAQRLRRVQAPRAPCA